MDDKRFRSDRERDPTAELARLIAQAHTHEESAPSDDRFREETISDGYDETPELPPAPQLTVDLLQQRCGGRNDRGDRVKALHQLKVSASTDNRFEGNRSRGAIAP